MKRTFTLAATICLGFFLLINPAWAEIIRVKEYPISPGIISVELSTFQGSIKWQPTGQREESRIVVEVAADGIALHNVRKALTQVRIVENIYPSSLLLEARTPTLPTGVNYVAVNYFVYLPPNQIRQFKAKTTNAPIIIDANFNGHLTLINDNAPIILRSGRGSVNLETKNASIELGFLDLVHSSLVQTNNGAISGQVTFPAQGKFSFLATNAPIDLKMPKDTSGTFNLNTSLGTVDFRLGQDILSGVTTVTIERSEEPIINISTSNSSITVSENRLAE